MLIRHFDIIQKCLSAVLQSKIFRNCSRAQGSFYLLQYILSSNIFRQKGGRYCFNLLKDINFPLWETKNSSAKTSYLISFEKLLQISLKIGLKVGHVLYFDILKNGCKVSDQISRKSGLIKAKEYCNTYYGNLCCQETNKKMKLW